MKWVVYSTIGFLALASMTMNASGDVIFSDDFTGSDGDPVNPSKWDVGGWDSEAIIDTNAGLLHGTALWGRGTMTSTTGADFLAAGATTTYTADLALLGSYAKARFGVSDGAVEFDAVKNGTWNMADISLSIAGEDVWSGTWNTTGSHLTIVLTPTTYEVTLTGLSTGTLSGTHSITSSEGKMWFRTDRTAMWEGQSLSMDNVQIAQVPEPATMSLLALGGLGVLIRRKR